MMPINNEMIMLKKRPVISRIMGSICLGVFSVVLGIIPEPAWGGIVPIRREGGLPFVQVEVNGKTQKLLIDSGSTHSFLTFAQAQSLGLTNALGHQGQIYYQIGAEALSVRRSPLVQVEVNFGGHKVTADVAVLWSGEYGIIGQDILSQFAIRIEPGQLVVENLSAPRR